MPVRIEGVVTPAAWDDDDNLSGVAVIAADVNEYSIDEQIGVGHDLYGLIGERVLVEGELSGRRLVVDRYEVLMD